MKTVYRLFAIACLSFAGFTGCAADSVPTTEALGIEAAPETTVIRYTAENIAALMPGEFLRLDLTLPNTIYAVTYADPANLDKILVVHRDNQYVLRDRAPATANDHSNTLKQVILSGDLVVDPGSGQSVAPPTDSDEHTDTAQQAIKADIAVCACPCCIQVSDHLVCCN